MLPVAERLKRPNLFARAYNARKLVSTPIFTLYVLPRNAQTKRVLPMVGFVISKKICKNATDRNKMKRRFREAYRKISAQVGQAAPIQNWYALVFVIKDKALTISWSEIGGIMNNAFAEAQRKYG
jgi:ribonuclease P protein component